MSLSRFTESDVEDLKPQLGRAGAGLWPQPLSSRSAAAGMEKEDDWRGYRAFGSAGSKARSIASPVVGTLGPWENGQLARQGRKMQA